MWQCKLHNLVANFANNANGATWWPNFEPMQVVPSVGNVYDDDDRNEKTNKILWLLSKRLPMFTNVIPRRKKSTSSEEEEESRILGVGLSFQFELYSSQKWQYRRNTHISTHFVTKNDSQIQKGWMPFPPLQVGPNLDNLVRVTTFYCHRDKKILQSTLGKTQLSLTKSNVSSKLIWLFWFSKQLFNDQNCAIVANKKS